MRSSSAVAKYSAFTLVELLTVIVIMAVLVTAAGFFTASYIAWAKQVSDQKTLQTLNDALTRYKTQGGNINSLTVGANLSSVITALKTPVNWAGMTHQFLQSGLTIPARSLKAMGNRAQYHFYSYNSYQSVTPAAGTPTSTYPYGLGNGYMSAASPGTFTVVLDSSSGWVCFQDQAGNNVYRAVPGITSVSLPSATAYTFWGCVGNNNPTASGNITFIDCRNNQLTSLNLSGLTSLFYVCMDGNQVASLNLKGLNALQFLYCNGNQLPSLDVSGLPLLYSIDCRNNQLTSLNLSACPALKEISCNDNRLTSSVSNSILAQLVATGQTGGNLYYKNQNQSAPATGQGITDKATLVSRGWNVQMD